LRIVTAAEMRNLDQAAIGQLGIPGVVLMENAGLGVVQVVEKILGDVRGRKVLVLAGKGNNGGDGFVVARHLLNMGAEVKVLLLAEADQISGDARINLDILQKMGLKIYSAVNANSLNIVKIAVMYTDLIIDAIYGTGFTGAVSEHAGNIIAMANESGKPIVAVDIPSGVEADSGRVNGPCIRASHTVTFGLPKLGLILEPGAGCCGDLTVADISIPEGLIDRFNIKRFLITGEMVRSWLPARSPESHKGSFGRVVVLGGSEGLTGAAALAAEGALRAGAGLVTLGVPKSLNGIMEVKLTEVMTKPLPETDGKSLSREAQQDIEEMLAGADVAAIGPGLSRNPSTIQLVQELLPNLKIPAVIDADGLNALAWKVEVLQQVQAPLVLTPHPGEMARLIGKTIEEVQANRLETAGEAAREWQKVVVLKGARTVIACPDGSLYINTTGNPGMATGGTGDVLTGIIAGLIAQGLTPQQAAVAGVYLHGAAGDYIKARKGMMALVAGDLLEGLAAVTRDMI